MSESGKLTCRCGNTARLGETRCGRCLTEDALAEAKEDLWQDIIRARWNMREDDPMGDFADAVIAYLEGMRP